MSVRRVLWVWFVFWALPACTWAEDLLMARSTQAFPEAMASLQELVRQQGYVVSRVQRVDVGLNASGFKTDMYRLVFIGRPGEIEALVDRHPELAAYLPYKIAVFAEGQETLAVTIDPSELAEFFPDPALAEVFARWSRDLHAIMDRFRRQAD